MAVLGNRHGIWSIGEYYLYPTENYGTWLHIYALISEISSDKNISMS